MRTYRCGSMNPCWKCMAVWAAFSVLPTFVVAQVEFRGLGDLPGLGGGRGGSEEYFYSQAYGVSGDGAVVVGESSSLTGDSEAFIWTWDAGMMGIGVLPDEEDSTALATSEDGSLVLGISPRGLEQAPFTWTQAGGSVALPGFNIDGRIEVRDFSANGSVVVGTTFQPSHIEGFHWTEANGLVGIGYLPGDYQSVARGISADGQVIVGNSNDGRGVEAMRWSETDGMVGLGFLDGVRELSVASAVSQDGSVVVGYSSTDHLSFTEAFRWTESEGMQSLGVLAGVNGMTATAVSGDGSVIIGHTEHSFDLLDGHGAFIWDEATGLRYLRDVLIDYGIDMTGWQLNSARDISTDGLTIVGEGINPNGDREGWIVRLPEPASLTLLLMSCLMVRRR